MLLRNPTTFDLVLLNWENVVNESVMNEWGKPESISKEFAEREYIESMVKKSVMNDRRGKQIAILKLVFLVLFN